jgi:type I restriction enzyme, R subunit
MGEQLFEDFKSKYLDLYDKVKSDHQKEKVSILEDVDFELELIHRDEINVAYIIQLLIKLKSSVQTQHDASRKEIFNLLNTEAHLRSKRELIELFIKANLPEMQTEKEIFNLLNTEAHINLFIKANLPEIEEDIPQEFEKFWNAEQQKAFNQLVIEEKLSAEKTQSLIEDYLYAEREPLRDEILELLEGEQPTLLERKKTGDRILKKILNFVETFIIAFFITHLVVLLFTSTTYGKKYQKL